MLTPRHSALLLLILLSACASMEPLPGERADPSPRLTNLQRAAQYPWMDDGHCVVREASNKWPILAERCFHALDHDRIRFRDVTGQCAVASAPAAAAAMGVGLCLFASPAVITGAVIVIATVVVAIAIKEGLDAYERSASSERAKRKIQIRPSSEQEPVTNREPTPRGLGRDWLPPVSSDSTEPRPECRPVPVPHLGGDAAHNECADEFPPNRYPGMDVLVNGKRFDALQVGVRVLWEIKTDQFDTYSEFLQEQVGETQVEALLEERRIAQACGYGFVIGVSSAAHRQALLDLEPSLAPHIVVTGCKR
ncbi:DUF6310 domain-containing protein [Hyalangium versicolor]|uniref:DUF6310 domain-containing protein n=1 Tax=Hyalangium versicolor TaxID=2861190 RepID=UPI001CCABB26|nr:DUF6310 domain-containing protein [Hyalangium versicolor]